MNFYLSSETEEYFETVVILGTRTYKFRIPNSVCFFDYIRKKVYKDLGKKWIPYGDDEDDSDEE
jgi:hypothetical protein